MHPRLKPLYNVQKKVRRRIGAIFRVDKKVAAIAEGDASEDDRITTLRHDGLKYRFVCHNEKERQRAERMFDKEKGTIAWLERELRPDDVFFDIGANIGIYTIFGARRIGDAGAVVAFEPHIPNANSLIENVFINGLQHKVRLVTAALTNSDRYDKFNYRSKRASSSMSQFGVGAHEGASFEPKFVEIKAGCSLDLLLSSGLLPAPDVIKIDVDGTDFEVLEGMRELLRSPKRPRSIQVELSSESEPKIMRLFAETGYLLTEKHWTNSGLEFIAQGNDPEDYYPHNAIFRWSEISGEDR